MCGFAGVLSFSNKRVTPELITRMRDTMPHRGPDGKQTWISSDERVGLGHRRLSIIDLSEAAAQPMSNQSGDVWLVFNGEIYNHAEIKRELDASGRYRWRTDHSDSEVILHAFTEWNIECIHKFRGMFAFALWDGCARELFLVRDRIGIKPLYYSVHDGRIAFASEIKALLADPDQRAELNEEALYHYLSFLTVPAPDTLFKGIKKLRSGTWLRIRANGDIKEQRYWDPLTQARDLSGATEEEITRAVIGELRTSVQLRKVSDVPVGVFLSGGIDSSTNAALFSEGETQPVRTFSIGYDGDYASYQNELSYAQSVAKFVGAEHHELRLTPDHLLDFLPRMVELQDEPIGDPVCVPVYYVSKLARDNGVIVCQLGEGADELFCGYPSWLRQIQLQDTLSRAVPRTASSTLSQVLQLTRKQDGFLAERLRRAGLGQPVFWTGADAFTDFHKRRLLSPRLRKQFLGRTSWDVLAPLWNDFNQNARERSALNWMTYVDLQIRLPELLLMRVDKMSMGVSLEGRVPFLDHEFVSLAMGISSALKTKDRSLKYILKKSVRGIIPDEIIDRPKQGFGVPLHEWFVDRLGEFAKAELQEFCKETDIFDIHEIKRVLAGPNKHQAWYLLNFVLWWRRFIHGSRPKPSSAVA
jgi:asparagine synthase (glutamine-hydrolysing)